MSLLEKVLEHEGFRAKPYQDTLGIWTIGHGLTWISEDESKEIVLKRLFDLGDNLMDTDEWLTGHPRAVLEVLTEMAFQMGLRGVRNFKKMWAALEQKDYATAADEMLDSKWASQTPNRAKALSQIIRDLA